MTAKKFLIGTILLSILLIVGASFLLGGAEKGSNLDTFAKCLKDKKTVFYGAFWCPHCQNQKKLFGSSEQYLPYVECSTPDGQRQTQDCKKKNIKSYPTWEFTGGSRKTGEVSLEELSQKTNCALPNK